MSENDRALSNGSAERSRELPPAWVSVWVACGKIRCLGYRTSDGKWVATFSGVELRDVTDWSAI